MRAEGGQSSTARMRGGSGGECQEATYEASAGRWARTRAAQQASPLACGARLPLLHFPPRSLAPSCCQTASITKADHTFQGLASAHPWYMPTSKPSVTQWPVGCLTVDRTSSAQGKGKQSQDGRSRPGKPAVASTAYVLLISHWQYHTIHSPPPPTVPPWIIAPFQLSRAGLLRHQGGVCGGVRSVGGRVSFGSSALHQV
jgi:hypothetical protein